MGQSGFGTKIGYTVGGSTTYFARVISVNPDPGEVDDIEFSDNDSVDAAAESEPGIFRPGECELELNYDQANTELVYSLLGVPHDYEVELPDGSTWTGSAYIKKFGQEYPHDAAITQAATLKWCEKPAFTAADAT